MIFKTGFLEVSLFVTFLLWVWTFLRRRKQQTDIVSAKREAARAEQMRLRTTVVRLTEAERGAFKRKLVIVSVLCAVFLFVDGLGLYENWYRWQNAEQITGQVTYVRSTYSGRRHARKTYVTVQAEKDSAVFVDSFYATLNDYHVGDVKSFLFLPIEKDGKISYEFDGVNEPKHVLSASILYLIITLLGFGLMVGAIVKILKTGTTILANVPKKYRNLHN